MKNLIIIPLLLLALLSCSKDNNIFTLKGHISNVKGSIFTLSKDVGNGVEIIDTLNVDEKGNFIFKYKLSDPILLFLTEKGSVGGFTSIFAEDKTLTLEADANDLIHAKVTGSKLNDSFSAINRKEIDLMMSYSKQKKSNVENLKLKFVKENPESHLSAFYIRQIYYLKSLDKLKQGFSELSSKLDGSIYYNLIKSRISRLEKVRVGEIAPSFTMNDANGKTVSLSDFRGKYLLLDFWASWCSPCRHSNPELVKLYKKYETKDFSILSVSLDSKKAAWLKAINEDGLTWSQVSDLKGMNNHAAKLYVVSGVPHTYLIDKEGKIINDNIQGEDLEHKLAEIFGK